MNFSDKLILLRKQNGLSQEDLAEKLDVTRQSVSKWESGVSMPELSKILQISQLFNVSTDYLLKEADSEQSVFNLKSENLNIKKVSQTEADDFILHSKKLAMLYTIATILCILSPFPLMLTLANPAFKLFSTTFMIISGIAGLLVFVAAGTCIFIYANYKNLKFTYIDNQDFIIDRPTRENVEKQKQAYYGIFIRNIIIGVIFCIISAIPVIVFALLITDYIGAGVCFTLLVVICGVSLFIYTGTRFSAFQKLLSEGEYSKKRRTSNLLMEKICGIYWPVIAAVYLVCSFLGNNWHISWIIWPVAALLFAVMDSVVNIITEKDSESKKSSRTSVKDHSDTED